MTDSNKTMDSAVSQIINDDNADRNPNGTPESKGKNTLVGRGVCKTSNDAISEVKDSDKKNSPFDDLVRIPSAIDAEFEEQNTRMDAIPVPNPDPTSQVMQTLADGSILALTEPEKYDERYPQNTTLTTRNVDTEENDSKTQQTPKETKLQTLSSTQNKKPNISLLSANKSDKKSASKIPLSKTTPTPQKSIQTSGVTTDAKGGLPKPNTLLSKQSASKTTSTSKTIQPATGSKTTLPATGTDIAKDKPNTGKTQPKQTEKTNLNAQSTETAKTTVTPKIKTETPKLESKPIKPTDFSANSMPRIIVPNDDDNADQTEIPTQKNEKPAPKEVSIDNALDDMLLAGIGEQKIEKTAFSSPASPEQGEKKDNAQESATPDAQISDIHLEQNENIPETLAKIINDYDDEIAHSSNKNEKVCEIQLAIARLLEHASLEKLAYVRYLCAYERNPRSVTAIRELRRIARAYNRMDDVITLVNAEIEAGVTPERRAELYEEYSRLVRFMPGAEEEMIKGLKGAIALAPENTSAHEMLATQYIFSQNWREAIDVLAKLAHISKDKSFKTGYFIEMGELAENCLNDIGLASSCYLRAQEESPDSFTLMLQLIPLLAKQNRFPEMNNVFRRFLETCKNPSLVQALQISLSNILSDKCSNIDEGIRCLEEAYNASSNDRLLLDLLAELYASSKAHWEDLDKTYDRLIHSTLDMKERVSLALNRADNLIRNKANPSRILDVLKQAHNDQPGDKHIQSRLRTCYYEMGNFDESARFAWKLAEQATPSDAADRFTRLGSQFLEMPGREDDAAKCFMRALSLDPNHRMAFSGAETLLRKKNKFAELANLYESRIGATHAPQQKAMLLRTLASIYEYYLQNIDSAIHCLKAYRDIYPDDLDAVTSLQRLYSSRGDWLAVIEMLNIECSLTEDHVKRAEILVYISDICKFKLARESKCIDFLRLAIDEDSNNLSAYRRIAESLRKNHDWPSLLDVSREMYNLLDNDEKLSMVCEMGGIYEVHIGNDELAIENYRKALELDPMCAIAFSGLERIYKRTQNWQAYCDIILWRSTLNYPKEQLVSMHYRVARMLALKFNRFSEAQKLLEAALKLESTHLPTLELLCTLYAITGQWEPLIRIYQMRIGSDEEAKTRAAYAYYYASILYWKLGRLQDAINPLELSLALVPSMPAARNTLLRTLIQLRQFNDLPPIYQEHSLCCNDDKLAVAYCLEAVDFVHSNPSVQPDENAHADEVLSLQRILKIDPENAIAIERLEAMEPIRSNLAPYWEKRISRSQGDENIELRLSLAEANINKTPQAAFELLCEVTKLSPQHLPAIRMAANAAFKLNNYMLACRFRAAEAEALDSNEMKINAWIESANIARNNLNNPDIAIQTLRQAFLLNPKRKDVCDALLALLQQKQDWIGMNSLLTLHAGALDNKNKAETLDKMADIYLNQLHEPQQAVVKLREYIDINPNNLQILEKLVDVELALEHWNEAKSGLEKLLQRKRLSRDQRHHYRTLLATVLYDKLSDTDYAEKILLEELAEDETDVETLNTLGLIYTKSGRYQESIHLQLKLLPNMSETEKPYALMELADNYRLIHDTDNLNKTLLTAVAYVTKDISILNIIREKCTDFNELALVLDYIRTLLEDNSIDLANRIKLYAFVVECYRGPLHMRFEADKYALAAVQRAPQNLDAQLLAAGVFDPKEALIHAQEAISLDPFNIRAYETMKHIAETSSKLDLLGRIEVLTSNLFQTNISDLGRAIIEHVPDGFRSMSVEQMIRFAREDLDLWTLELFRRAGRQAQIFALPAINSAVIPSNMPFVQLARSIAQSMDLPNIELRYTDTTQFLYTYKNDDPEVPIFAKVIVEEAPPAEQRFHIACALSRIKMGSAIFKLLDINMLLRLLNGCVGLIYEQFGEPDIVKTLNSILPRKDKRAVMDFVSATDFSKLNSNPNLLQSAATSTEYRIGLIYCCDIAGALAGLLRKQAPGLRFSIDPTQILPHLQHTRNVPEIISFYLSEKYAEARQILGLQLIADDPSLL